MGHEISQLDIQDRQLLATNAQSRAATWTEIGEAEITHTIFGRAKVRIIRKHDRARRAWLLAAMLVVAAIAVAAWQVWIASRQTEPLQSAVPSIPESAKVQESVPALQPENVVPPVTPLSLKSEPITSPQAEINKPAISQKSAAQLSSDLKGGEKETVKPVTVHRKPVMAQPRPVTPQPLAASKPQTTPLAADSNALKNQTDMQQSTRLSPPKQLVAPAVTQPAAQSAAGGPVDMAPLASPIVKEDTTAQSPAGDKQPAEPGNAQNK